MTELNPIDLQKALKGAQYPASREDLTSLAQENGADNTLVKEISDAGPDRFDGPDDVQEALFSNG